MNLEEIKKKIIFANMVLDVIRNIDRPMLIYEEEKQVVKEALQKYVDELEDKLR